MIAPLVLVIALSGALAQYSDHHNHQHGGKFFNPRRAFRYYNTESAGSQVPQIQLYPGTAVSMGYISHGVCVKDLELKEVGCTKNIFFTKPPNTLRVDVSDTNGKAAIYFKPNLDGAYIVRQGQCSGLANFSVYHICQSWNFKAAPGAQRSYDIGYGETYGPHDLLPDNGNGYVLINGDEHQFDHDDFNVHRIL